MLGKSLNDTKRLRETPITVKQKIFLTLRFVGLAFFWYLVSQIVLGALTGFIFVFGSDYQSHSQEEIMIHFFEDFFNSGAAITIIILSLIVSLGVSTLQTLSKIKQYKQENSRLAEQQA